MIMTTKKLYIVNKLQTVVGAKLACIEGATTPGLTGYTPQYHMPLCWFFFAPNKDLRSLAPTTSLKKNINVELTKVGSIVSVTYLAIHE